MQDSRFIKWWLRLIWVLVILLALIGIGMVLRRSLILAGMIPSVNPAGGKPFDDKITSQPVLTFVHMLPGLLFMILGPLQFIPRFQMRYPRFHRRSGRVFVVCAYLVGLSALVMAFRAPIGGVNETAATAFYAIFFLVALSLALRYILRKQVLLHREWMLRAFAIGLAVATIRPIVGIFFAFSGLSPQVFFGTAFWIGFTLHLVAAEVWINCTRS